MGVKRSEAAGGSSAMASLTELFERSSAMVNGFVYTRCGSSALAEEVTAQTFEEAARRFRDGRGDEVDEGWLRMVARRRLMDSWRRRDRSERLWRRLADNRPGAADDDIVGSVRDALDQLSVRHRLVLTLRYLDDWSVSEIADAIGSSYSATESLLARARRGFSEAFEEQR